GDHRHRHASWLRPQRVRAQQSRTPPPADLLRPALRPIARTGGADPGLAGQRARGGDDEREVLRRRARDGAQRGRPGRRGRSPSVGGERAAGGAPRGGGMRGARRRRRWLLGVGAVAAVLAAVPVCRLFRSSGVRLSSRGRAEGTLLAGGGAAPIAVPYPVVAAGYGTARTEVDRAAVPPEARALVLVSGGEVVGLVTLDLLLGDDARGEAVRRRAAGLRLSTLWVAATHSHSSLGAYATNPVVQVAGTGRFRPEVRDAVVTAAAQALSRAVDRLQPVTAFAGTSPLRGHTTSRDEFPEVDARLTRLVLRGANGPVGQLVV